MLDAPQTRGTRRGSRPRRLATVLAALGVALGIAAVTGPAAFAASTATSTTVHSRLATGQAATSGPVGATLDAASITAGRLGSGTAVRSATTDPAAASSAVKPAFAGFCITAWSGRYISTNCYGVGVWRQYADCSASGFTYTSPWLPEPPIGSWIGACPAGQYVISANVQF